MGGANSKYLIQSVRKGLNAPDVVRSFTRPCCLLREHPLADVRDVCATHGRSASPERSEWLEITLASLGRANGPLDPASALLGARTRFSFARALELAAGPALTRWGVRMNRSNLLRPAGAFEIASRALRNRMGP